MDVEVLSFAELSKEQLYMILKNRFEVFFLEQDCICQDMDDEDQRAAHLLLTEGGELLAYARLFLPGQVYEEASIGRVLVPKVYRGKGLGRDLTCAAIEWLESKVPNCKIKISAQHHVEQFYQEFGFVSQGGIYDECGIAHIKMVRG